MTEQTPWRPLGVDTPEAIEAYDQLHLEMTPWLADSFWPWLGSAFVGKDSRGVSLLRLDRLHQMDRILHVRSGKPMVHHIEQVLRTNGADPFVMADFVLARGYAPQAPLEDILREANSAWKVGVREDHPGLVHRVPEGVQGAVDETVARPWRAGRLLGAAWGHAYGVDGDPDTAYREAVRAVEDVTVPLVCPRDRKATLGKVVAVFRDQASQWRLPPAKRGEQDPHATLLAMMETLWEGDPRHGGQQDQPVHPTHEDAIMAVSLAVSIINIWHSGVVVKDS